MEKLFLYGTLREPEIQKEVLGRTADSVPDILEGFRKLKITIGGQTYPMLIPSDDGSVDGDVIEVSEEEFHKIDEYETRIYMKRKANLKSGTIAWVYVRR